MFLSDVFSYRQTRIYVWENGKIFLTCIKIQNMPATLILVTESYPYGGVTESVFIESELGFLSRMWTKVLLIPCIKRGESANVANYPNVEVCDDWLNWHAHRSRFRRLRYVAHADVWREFVADRGYTDVTYALSAVDFGRFIRRFMSLRGLRANNTLVYSFWLDYPATGAVLYGGGLNVVSRAHGYDVNMKRASYLRSLMMSKINKVYAASEASAKQLCQRFPTAVSNITRCYLGSREPSGQACWHSKSERKLVFLSCSRVVESKRVCMNFEMMRALAIARPDTEIKWIHIGSGDRMEYLRRKLSDEKSPSNLSVELLGELNNDEVHKIYVQRKIDWFVLLSSYEGGCPISVCEAMSYGTPVIATDTGGLSEIVDDDSGILMAFNPEKEEFVRGIVPYLDSEYRYESLRNGAYERWRKKFSAMRLRFDFAVELRSYVN